MSGKSESSPADPSESNGVIQDLLLEQLLGMTGCSYQNLEVEWRCKRAETSCLQAKHSWMKKLWVKAQTFRKN